MKPSLLRFAGACLLTVAGVCAAGAWPLSRAYGSAGLASMAIAAGIALVGALVGFLPILRVASASLDVRAQAVLVGVGVRMIATLAAVAIVAFAGLAPDRTVFLLSSATLYAVLLVVETMFATRSVAAPAGPTAA